jgi:hypothetical protein
MTRPSELPILKYFTFAHLRPGTAQNVSALISETVKDLVEIAAAHEESGNPLDMAELVAGMRKLLEAKDCFVRAVLARKD